MLLLTNGDNNKPYGLLPPDSSSRKALDIFQHLAGVVISVYCINKKPLIESPGSLY